MMKKYRYLFAPATLLLLLGFVLHLSCCSSNRSPRSNHEAFLNVIPDSIVFHNFAGYPLQNALSDVQSVKVIYDIHAHTLYYINSNKYKLHFDFCESELNYSLGLAIFNATNYTNTFKRDYFLGTINYFSKSDVYALEFFADNEMTAAQINFLYKEISGSSFIKNRLKLFLNSENISSVYNEGELKLPVITIDEVYQHQQYQLIEEGRCIGRLKLIDSMSELKNADLRDCIVMTNGTPLEMPVCRAFVSNVFQTPLSHIQVLAHHRNIPAAALKNCMEQYRSLDNKPVRITINRDSIQLHVISENELKHDIQHVIIPVSNLGYDTSNTSLLPVSAITKASKKAVGNKAYNFSRLYEISRKKSGLYTTPEAAFAIPYFFYKQHLQSPEIQSEIRKLELIRESNGSALRKQLKRIQELIKTTPINALLLKQVTAQLSTSDYRSFRFRSSCNAEDLANFSGAGLYDSYTGRLQDSTKRVENAIRKVWASTFNYRAYVERRQFNINESTVMMGILVHRSFPNEKSNGVVITKNIYRDDYPGYIVNVQYGDVSVVNPPDNIVCDQFICASSSLINPLSSELAIQYVSRSSLNGGKQVLSKDEIRKLYEAVHAVSESMNLPDYLDLEFKFDENGKLYLKQVRPYK